MRGTGVLASLVVLLGVIGAAAALPPATSHDCTPEVHAWPPAPDGAPAILVSWTATASGAAGRSLALELWRAAGHGIERIWSSAAPFPDGLWALGVSVTPGRI